MRSEFPPLALVHARRYRRAIELVNVGPVTVTRDVGAPITRDHLSVRVPVTTGRVP